MKTELQGLMDPVEEENANLKSQEQEKVPGHVLIQEVLHFKVTAMRDSKQNLKGRV